MELSILSLEELRGESLFTGNNDDFVNQITDQFNEYNTVYGSKMILFTIKSNHGIFITNKVYVNF